jgi:hypothetical protein
VKTVQHKAVALTHFDVAHAGFCLSSYSHGENWTTRMLTR